MIKPEQMNNYMPKQPAKPQIGGGTLISAGWRQNPTASFSAPQSDGPANQSMQQPNKQAVPFGMADWRKSVQSVLSAKLAGNQAAGASSGTEPGINGSQKENGQ